MTAAPAKSFKAAAVQFVHAWGGVHGNISRLAAGIEDLEKQRAGAARNCVYSPEFSHL